MRDVVAGRRAALQLRLQLAQRGVDLVLGRAARARAVRRLHAAARQRLQLDLELEGVCVILRRKIWIRPHNR